jgi:hypothetical protein
MGEVVRMMRHIQPLEPVIVPKTTEAQRQYLKRGLSQPGGKLPLFDGDGQQISLQTIKSCIRAGWAEPWFENPIKPDWVVCKLTDLGRGVLKEDGVT